MPRFQPIITKIDSTAARTIAGLSSYAKIPEHLFEQACQQIRQEVNPSGTWSLYSYDPETDTILATPSLALTTSSFASHFIGVQKIAIMTVTIGLPVSEAVNQEASSKNYTQVLLLNAAAKAALEQSCLQLYSAVSQQAYQLGYAATVQIKINPEKDHLILGDLIRLAEGESIGITINKNFTLTPEYSLLSIMGFNHYQYHLNIPSTNQELLGANNQPLKCHAKKTL